jgi:hypothetical protein
MSWLIADRLREDDYYLHYSAFDRFIKNNVPTAESPIEVLLENVSQTQVDDDVPYTYAMWARGILRQSPDVVMMDAQTVSRRAMANY